METARSAVVVDHRVAHTDTALGLCYIRDVPNTTTLTVRLDSDIKDAARRRASRLGINLSTLIENDLRRFINGHPIIIDDDSFVPPERLLADIEEAEAELARGETTSVTVSQLDAYFDSLSQAGS